MFLKKFIRNISFHALGRQDPLPGLCVFGLGLQYAAVCRPVSVDLSMVPDHALLRQMHRQPVDGLYING